MADSFQLSEPDDEFIEPPRDLPVLPARIERITFDRWMWMYYEAVR